jgi:hypothetical protein
MPLRVTGPFTPIGLLVIDATAFVTLIVVVTAAAFPTAAAKSAKASVCMILFFISNVPSLNPHLTRFLLRRAIGPRLLSTPENITDENGCNRALGEDTHV